MPDINLTEQEVQTLLRCLNDRVEPPEELAKKLFPKLYAGFDFKTLNRASIPTIEYAGKRSAAAILNEASAFGAGSPLQIVRFFRRGKLQKEAQQLELIKEAGPTWDTGWKNMIVQGDNLQFLKTCFLDQDPLIKGKVKGKVNLVYLDPPFATKSDFAAKEGEDSYADRVDRAEFIEALRERLLYVKELLSDDGAIYVHLDSKMHHYMKVCMDEIFGKENFRNEIFVRRIKKNIKERNKVPRLNDALDIILFYSRSRLHLIEPSTRFAPKAERWHGFDAPGYRTGMDYELFGVRPEPNRHWMWDQNRAKEAIKDGDLRSNENTGKPEYRIEASDYDLRDSLWDDITALAFTTGYPTEKKEEMIELILLQSSKPGDLVMDVFGGSGTTAAVAEKLGMRWVTCDFGKHAIYTMQKRLVSISDSRALRVSTPANLEIRCESCSSVIAESRNFKRCKKCGAFVGKESGKKNVEYGRPPQDFCVISVGAFDFSKIMDLRKNRDAYIAFVLGIFGITERSDHFAKKYHVSNVVAQKNDNPVEVYPVWDDDYLRKVRVDMDYLRGILGQAGGKLKGDYYVVSPESCVRVGAETVLKNAKGEKVTFHMLTFPYKVLEDAARNFQLSEQPSAPENINKLISSVGFYFHEEVEIKVKKNSKGFKVTDFKTTILNASEERFEGLDGLAMILVDTEYDGETFNVDACVYQKDMKDGEVTLKGINGKTAIIAVDKHGNESKITLVK